VSPSFSPSSFPFTASFPMSCTLRTILSAKSLKLRGAVEPSSCSSVWTGTGFLEAASFTRKLILSRMDAIGLMSGLNPLPMRSLSARAMRSLCFSKSFSSAPKSSTSSSSSSLEAPPEFPGLSAPLGSPCEAPSLSSSAASPSDPVCETSKLSSPFSFCLL